MLHDSNLHPVLQILFCELCSFSKCWPYDLSCRIIGYFLLIFSLSIISKERTLNSLSHGSPLFSFSCAFEVMKPSLNRMNFVLAGIERPLLSKNKRKGRRKRRVCRGGSVLCGPCPPPPCLPPAGQPWGFLTFYLLPLLALGCSWPHGSSALGQWFSNLSLGWF